ncbi:MAG: gamma-glutamyltransferase [Erysipelotrichaceae bacterium]|nr:gamma-glutamyltransferase [Erysipelotrichaceae bacterium]MDY5251561.1 gamma-glutamyltransferase [Erysipelotrichaceae bacterium]
MFDPLYQNYASNRYCVTAAKGMVSTSNALASSAGLEILKKGGNAVDAAIATAATLTVVEPTSNGLGSDAFALVWMKDHLYGLNASGPAPKNISIEKVNSLGYRDKMPTYGWIPVTVPGAPKAWASLSQRFGKLTLEECLEPAIRYAKEGYPVSPMLSRLFANATAKYQKVLKDKMFDEWFRVFTKNGDAYQFGDIIKLPDHARSLELIAKTNAQAFYQGEIAKAMVKQSQRDGGFLELEDLADFDVKWVEPISVNYRGYDIWEIPPNGQGIVALMALNILKEFKFGQKDDPNAIHQQFEAMKMAFADGMKYVSDPNFTKLDYHHLIDPNRGASRANEIDDHAHDPKVKELPKSGTVYLCAADSEGNMVSYIQSNYMDFGSGIVVEGYGVALQNRGADFSLDPSHYNALMPQKRTYHTIIPGFITKNNKAVAAFGVMGAYMQPQGHVQVVTNLLDYHMNPQMALDAYRWQWLNGKKFVVEPSFPTDIIEILRKKGHEIEIAKDRISFGRGQIIWRLDNGVLVGGCESRTDSNIACY